MGDIMQIKQDEVKGGHSEEENAEFRSADEEIKILHYI